ncbi:MAG: M23 family metallopeptidase [Candidatus Dependentiae bacterium]|nr:M23 family metallopeptidase [Candidatus Dependentiae bacterium]
MVFRIRSIIVSLTLLCLLFVGYRTTRYFFDHSFPEVTISGLEAGGVYAGDIACMLHGSDAYRVRSLSLTLDDTPLVEQHKINKRAFDYPFVIPTKTLPDGKHRLRTAVTDSSYSAHRTEREIEFFVDNVPLRAAFTAHDATFKVTQGNTLRVQFQVNKPLRDAQIQILSTSHRCHQENGASLIYECFVPIKSDEQPSEYPFTIQMVDRVGNRSALDGKLDVIAAQFPKQLLRVGKEKIEKEEMAGRAEREFEPLIAQITAQSPVTPLWKGAFYAPCDMRGVTTQFGTIRTSEERGRYRHDAVDLSAMPRSIVWAAQDGTVVLKDRFVHSGNTVILDHGAGIITLYFHLDSFADIAVGDTIKKGKPLGRLGMTGYASGYHLHWELRINNVPVNPLQWIDYTF